MTWVLVIVAVVAFWFAVRTRAPAPKIVLMACLFLVAVFAALFYVGRPPDIGGEGEWKAEESRSAIDLSGGFRTLDGRTVSLDQFQGNPLFLNVWATWCGPCRMEMPSMAELYKEFSAQGLQMVAVTSEDAQTVSAFLRNNRYPFTILLDPEDVLSSRFGIEAIPTTFIVDAQGRLAYRHVGYNQWNSPSVRLEISKLLQ